MTGSGEVAWRPRGVFARRSCGGRSASAVSSGVPRSGTGRTAGKEMEDEAPLFGQRFPAGPWEDEKGTPSFGRVSRAAAGSSLGEGREESARGYASGSRFSKRGLGSRRGLVGRIEAGSVWRICGPPRPSSPRLQRPRNAVSPLPGTNRGFVTAEVRWRCPAIIPIPARSSPPPPWNCWERERKNPGGRRGPSEKTGNRGTRVAAAGPPRGVGCFRMGRVGANFLFPLPARAAPAAERLSALPL